MITSILIVVEALHGIGAATAEADVVQIWRLTLSRLEIDVATDVARVLGGVAPHLMVSPTRPTALITTRLGAIRPADRWRCGPWSTAHRFPSGQIPTVISCEAHR